MKHRYWIMSAWLLAASSAGAQGPREFGLGVGLGNPTAVTAKYWADRIHAVQGGVGTSGDLTLYADYLLHGWKALPQPKEGKLAAYLGAGLRWEEKKRKDEFGIRGVTGVSYWLKTGAVEFFAELVPFLRLEPDSDTSLDGAAGFRYYFKGFN